MHEYCLASRYRGDTGVNTSWSATSKAMTQNGMIRTLHRRLGLVLGPAVLLWFLSGVVLLWVPYPSLTETEWFAAAKAIPLTKCCGALAGVVAQVERPVGIESVRVKMVGERLVAVAQLLDGSLVALAADTGAVLTPFTQEEIERIVQPVAAGRMIEAVELINYDVWTVHQRFDPYRPLWKVQLSGEDRSGLYVSRLTGDVVQDTTAEERRWNLVGAVLHWWYLPWLRHQWAWWDQVVWWVSAVGTVTVVAGGLILGWEWVKHGWSGCFTGRWKVHRALGVIAGVAACFWMASGWLSMDHGRWFSDGKIDAQERERFMGGRLVLHDLGVLPDLAVMSGQAAVKEIRLIKMAGMVHIMARTSSSQQAILAVPSQEEASREAFQDEVVKAAARSLLGDGVLTVMKVEGNESGACSAVGDDTAPPLTRVATTDVEPKEVLVDNRTGTLVERVDASRRLYHRLFNTFHRWDVPWLSHHCDLRRMLMSLWCLLGAGLAGSGIWMGLSRSGVMVRHR